MSWSYHGGDPGISLFSACMEAGAPMALDPGMRVLEIGCMEVDWLEHAHKAWPEVMFIGIDSRAPVDVRFDGKVNRLKADAMYADMFVPESFDAVVSLSAIEHVGLGHYGDPKDEDGDTKALANAFRWLKPGGWLYFDVPFDPTGYRLQGTKCRVYDKDALFMRCWCEPLSRAKGRGKWLWDGYAQMQTPSVLIPEPTKVTHQAPFAYAAKVWRKVG